MSSGQRGAPLRAYDKATGKEVGAVFMPAPQSGSPMTYMLNGEQYVAVAISGGNYSGEVVALKLSAGGAAPAQANQTAARLPAALGSRTVAPYYTAAQAERGRGLYGQQCARCHGAVEDMPRVVRVHDLSMKFCVDCHRDNNGGRGRAITRLTACSTCHR